MMAFAKKIVIFDAELIFNIRGLQFCLARSSEGIAYELKSEIHHKTLIEGLRLLNADVPREMLLSYLNTIRPTINSYQTLKALSDSSSQIKLLSFFEKDVLETTIESLKPFKELLGDLSEQIIYTSASTILEDLFHIKQHEHQIIVAHFDSAQMLKQNGFQVSHVKFPNEPGNEESLNSLRAILPSQPDPYDDYQ
ncbi:unnamed protein product [Blepharisma stoltei]|uniref:Uncharacterized protein n=1 Tax=Blepharisma stoltei TaxID=1481888 RepID=A0AAU9IYE2_9CILI|nr:unnamed protein product [Blepharisma stoltei]